MSLPTLPEAERTAPATLADMARDVSHTPAPLRTLCGVMQAARQPMFVVWGDSCRVFFNEACGTLLGEGRRSHFGQPVQAVWPEFAAEVAPLLRRVFAGEAVDVATTRFADGDAHFSVALSPIHGLAPGEVLGAFCACTDATPALRVLRETAEVERRRKQVLDSMGEGFIVLDTAFRLLEINAEGVRLDGRPEAALIGRLHWELWPAAVGTAIEHTFRRVMQERQPVQFQHHYRGEGHDVFVDVRVYPVTGGIAAFYRDVTALATADAALQQGHDRFAAAMRAIGVMWTNSADGRMLGSQPGWAKLTGQTEAEYSDFGWTDAVHPDDVAPTLAQWNSAVAEQRMFMFEHRVRRRDGAWRRFAIRAVPVTEKGGAVREWVGVHIDVTATVEAMEAVRAADTQKDEFLATLAHELRNPLGAIDSATALLLRHDLPAGKTAWLAGVLRRQTRVMTLLLDELLDISRFKSGSVALVPEQVSLATLIDTAVETVRHLLDASRHHLDLQIPAGSPDLFVDRLRTVQILANLLTNAIKFTDTGGHIAVRAAFAIGSVSIEITDDGIGLAAESIGTIFNGFVQVGTAAPRSVGGLGIGLTLARNLAELQGGTITASSAGLGRGSTFRVVLPLGDTVDTGDTGETAVAER